MDGPRMGDKRFFLFFWPWFFIGTVAVLVRVWVGGVSVRCPAEVVPIFGCGSTRQCRHPRVTLG